jgi:uncharacterized membrane protein
LYLVGVIWVTRVFNIPRNDALAAAQSTSAQGAALWSRYVNTWTAWNHVRTATAFVAMASFVMGLVRGVS